MDNENYISSQLKEPLLNNEKLYFFNSEKAYEQETKMEFEIAQYDEMCEDFSKIDKVICLHIDKVKLFFYVILNIFTLFSINLLVKWFPSLNLKLIYSKCQLKIASHIGIYGSDKVFYIEKLDERELPNVSGSKIFRNCRDNIYNQSRIKIFQFKYYDYVYDPIKRDFASVDFLIRCSHDKVHKYFSKGLNLEEYSYQNTLFSKGDIDVKVDSWFVFLFRSITHPFYVYTILSIILWFNNDYETYAWFMVFATGISISFEISESLNIKKNIKDMSNYNLKVRVFRRNTSIKDEVYMSLKNVEKEKFKPIEIENSDEFEEVSSDSIVPGDLIEIPSDGNIMPCDAVILRGSVVINEALLTGESTPVFKVQLSTNPELIFHERKCRSNIIHAGTKIIQVKKGSKRLAIALVLNTGFNTEKGNLVRSIVYPKDTEVKFKVDALKYIFVTASLAVIGYCICLPVMISDGISLTEMIFRGMDLFTDTVPSSLPFCIGLGITFSIIRLKEKNIRCISRERISDIGKVDLICLDKTGTLTEENLKIEGFRRARLDSNLYLFHNFQSEVNETIKESFDYFKLKVKSNVIKENISKSKELKLMFTECLACCHNIAKIDGKLVGDQIDLEMFKASGWKFIESLDQGLLVQSSVMPPDESELMTKLSNSNFEDEDNIIRNHYELVIIKRYDFSSKLQRMSVICKNPSEDIFKIFSKGSPEKILELCKYETIPHNFNETLAKYTSKGFRVLGLAGKPLKMSYLSSNHIDRTKLEKNMIFLGLMIIDNKLKDKTIPSIQELKDANQKMLMATGDNILTAIAVSKACGLITKEVKIFTCKIEKEEDKYEIKWEELEKYNEEDTLESIGSNKEIIKKRQTLTVYNEDDNDGSSLSADEVDVDDEEGLNYEEEIYNLVNEKEEENKKEMLEELKFHLEKDPDFNNIHIGFDPKKMTNFMEEEFIIAVQGSTFELLWKLRNNYTKKNDGNFKKYYDIFRLILQNTAIYARMAPDHKTILVESLKEENFIVLMCGDGANDCGALKAANVGVSLTKESSIAGDFTSETQDISCILDILKEGKCSLATSIGIFKAMVLYSIIQFLSVVFLICIHSYLLDNQFLTADLFIVPAMQVLMAYTEPSSTLTEHQPIGDLLSFPIITSILSQSSISFIFLYLGHQIIEQMPDYREGGCLIKYDLDNSGPCDKNTVIYFIATMQYFTITVIYSFSKPYRKPIYTNMIFLIYFIVSFTFFLKIFLFPDPLTGEIFDVVVFQNPNIKLFIALICGCNFIVCYFVEAMLIPLIFKIYYRAKYFETLRMIQMNKYNPNLQELQDMKKENRFLDGV